MPMAELPYDADEAVQHLIDSDAGLARLIDRTGPFSLTLRPLPSVFDSLSRSITYQQLSGQAAATILGRVKALFPDDCMSPEHFLTLDEEALRAAGLSRAKVRAMRDLADKVVSGMVPPLDQLHAMEEEAIVERLVQVRGIGRWTVEMLLIFSLGRPDVLPVSDLGIRRGFRLAFRTRGEPTPARMLERAARWRPFRSVASWYLWRAADQ